MECNYPDCMNCQLDDCEMNEKDIKAMLKRRCWKANPELFRQKKKVIERGCERIFHIVTNVALAFA